MSRSHRHTPVHGIAADSEKRSKRWWNRVFRRIERLAIRRDDDILPTNIRKETEVWAGAKDGKFRFDPREGQRLMRK